MRSSIISAAVLALASSVFAQTSGFDPITTPTQDQQVPAGSVLNIVWSPSPTGYDNDTVSITLLYGSSASTLQLNSTPIATNISNYLGTYAYTVPSSGLYATYGFKLSLDFDPTIFQYSFPFHISGGASVTGSATSTVTQTLATGPSYSANSSIASTTSTSTFASPTSNLTVSTSVIKTTTSASKTASSTSSSTTSAAATKSSSAAIGNAVTGGLAAFGGLVLAFAL